MKKQWCDVLSRYSLVLVAVLVFALFALLAERLVVATGPATPTGSDRPPIKPSIAFQWPATSPMGRSDEAKFAEVMLMQYAAVESSPVSESYSNQLAAYRQRLLDANPNVWLGIYTTPLRANIAPTVDYNWPSYDFNTLSGNYRNFLCDDDGAHDQNGDGVNEPRYVYNSAWSQRSRPDTHTWLNEADENSPFQPIYTGDRTDQQWAPWGAGVFGWPPAEALDGFPGGGLAQQSTLYCAPIVDHTNPVVVDFVVNGLIDILGRFSGGNTIVADNWVHFERYTQWPGWHEPMSPWRYTAPDNSFRNYTNRLNNSLADHGYHLVVNAGPYPFFTTVDGGMTVWMENQRIRRTDTTSEISSHLRTARSMIDNDVGVVHEYEPVNGVYRLDADITDWNFFLASTMLLYEPGKYAYYPAMCRPGVSWCYDYQNRPVDNFQFYPEFYLPTCAGTPASDFRTADDIPNLFYREFTRSAYFLNANDYSVTVTDADLREMGLHTRVAPFTLRAKEGKISFFDCSCGLSEFDNMCRQRYYSEPPARAPRTREDVTISAILSEGSPIGTDAGIGTGAPVPPSTTRSRGDLDCSGRVNESDVGPFVDALINPQSYQAGYPQCSRQLADMDCDGQVNNFDLTRLTQLLTMGHDAYRRAHPDCS